MRNPSVNIQHMELVLIGFETVLVEQGCPPPFTVGIGWMVPFYVLIV